MKFTSALKIALDAILINKVRTLLTTLGILIGIAAVIAMLSIGQGAQSVLLEQVQGLGSNTITILPIASLNFSGASFGNQAALSSIVSNRLSRNVVKLLENKVTFKEITAISPEISKSFEVNHESKTVTVSVYGASPAYFDVHELEVDQGRKINTDDDNSMRKIAVLGPRTATKLFGESDALDKVIKINGASYKVIGIATEKGSAVDDRIYVPLNTAANSLIGQHDYNQIIVKVSSDDLVNSVAVKMEDRLHEFYRLAQNKDAKYSLLTSKDILSIASSITTIFTTLLASIASISLVVGGIGIMNIMLVSVTERIKEIGLRKAVGAKRNAILLQFLLEAVVLTLVGGIMGIIVGLALGFLVGAIGNIPVVISWQAIALATSVSISIGIVFGFYPAYRAAQLNPIDALRYE